MISNTEEYISLQKNRANGTLPDMGCAIRVSDLINESVEIKRGEKREINILDVGCATGHFYRTFIRQGLDISNYTGLEIDLGMVKAANEVWSVEIKEGKVGFINDDIENFDGNKKFDFVICINAFMYFTSIEKVLRKLMRIISLTLIIGLLELKLNKTMIRRC